ncbi:hypothetical protein GCM10009714_34750 [Microlunatus capsulatus]
MVLTLTVAEVAPLASTPLAFTRPMSTPKLLVAPGLRPPVLAPKFEMAESKELLAGRAASASVVPPNFSTSPVVPRSPSQAARPTVALTVPAVGVMKPETLVETVEFAALSVVMSAKPSKTVRSRIGRFGLE